MEIQTTLTQMFPEGSVQGQCFEFMHKITGDFPPVGPSLQDKVNLVKNYGIPIDMFNKNFRPGDILVTNESTTNGHGACVNRLVGGTLRLTESNYRLDGKVHHTREIMANSPHIIGVIRPEHFKFNFPAPAFPVQIPVSIIMNNQNQADWNATLLSRLAEIQNWFYKNSEGKFELIIHDPKWVNLSGWQTAYVQGGLGNPFVQIIKEDWFDKNIVPLADPGAKIICFVMRPEDWPGQVFAAGLKDIGYCYEPHFPIKLFLAMQPSDNDFYPPTIPDLFGLSKWLTHEIMHGLYGIGLKANYPPGSDFCHLHFYPPGNFSDTLNDLDSAAIDSIINK